SPLEDLAGAGGYLGVVVAGPLASLLGPWGAGLVAVVLGIVGVVVLTDRTLAHAAGRTAEGVRPAGSVIRRGWEALFTLGEARTDDPGDVTDAIDLTDPDEEPWEGDWDEGAAWEDDDGAWDD